MPRPRSTSRSSRALSRGLRRGFTLLEALMASAILLGVVTAVTAAVTAGQQHSLEAQNRVAGALAAEALLARITSEPYATLATWNGFTEAPGVMTDEFAQPMPDAFGMIGRDASVVVTLKTINPPDVRLRGNTVTVRAIDATGRELISLSRFIAEPQGGGL